MQYYLYVIFVFNSIPNKITKEEYAICDLNSPPKQLRMIAA